MTGFFFVLRLGADCSYFGAIIGDGGVCGGDWERFARWFWLFLSCVRLRRERNDFFLIFEVEQLGLHMALKSRWKARDTTICGQQPVRAMQIHPIDRLKT